MAALRSTRRLAGALAINAWLPQAIARSRLRDRCVRPQSTLREAFGSSQKLLVPPFCPPPSH